MVAYPVPLLIALSLLSAAPAEVQLETPEVEGPRWVGAHVAAATVAAVGSVLGGVAVVGIPSACVARFERPEPFCTAGGLLLASAVQLAMNWLLLPEVFRLPHASVASVRDVAWRWGRWPAAGLALSVVLFGVGAALEHGRYGQGQALMLGSLGGAVVSGLTFDVLQVVGASRGARGLR